MIRLTDHAFSDASKPAVLKADMMGIMFPPEFRDLNCPQIQPDSPPPGPLRFSYATRSPGLSRASSLLLERDLRA